MTSIGYFSAVGGSGGQASPFVVNAKSPGGAIRGYMPQQNQTVDKQYSEFEQIRFTLKQAWNTNYNRQLKNSHLKKHSKKPDFLPPLNMMKSNSHKSSISSIKLSGLFEQLERIKKLML